MVAICNSRELCYRVDDVRVAYRLDLDRERIVETVPKGIGVQRNQ